MSFLPLENSPFLGEAVRPIRPPGLRPEDCSLVDAATARFSHANTNKRLMAHMASVCRTKFREDPAVCRGPSGYAYVNDFSF
jgi:hypothetical protein